MPKVPWFIWFAVFLITGLVIGFANLFVLVILSVLAPFIVAHLRATFNKNEKATDSKTPNQPQS